MPDSWSQIGFYTDLNGRKEASPKSRRVSFRQHMDCCEFVIETEDSDEDGDFIDNDGDNRSHYTVLSFDDLAALKAVVDYAYEHYKRHGMDKP